MVENNHSAMFDLKFIFSALFAEPQPQRSLGRSPAFEKLNDAGARARDVVEVNIDVPLLVYAARNGLRSTTRTPKKKKVGQSKAISGLKGIYVRVLILKTKASRHPR